MLKMNKKPGNKKDTSGVFSSCSGVTVVEINCVVLIIAIISLIAAPSVNRYIEATRLRAATRELVSDMMKARMASVGKNRTSKIIFTGSNEYSIVTDLNKNGVFEQNEIIETKNFSVSFSGVSIAADADADFSPRGTAASIQVRLTNATGTLIVSVNVAGRVKIES